MKYVCNTRRGLLERLPKNSTGVEIGVWKGDFSAVILDVVKPAKLYLVDPWVHLPSDEFKDGMNVSDAKQHIFYEHVLTRFAKPIETGQVVVRQMRSWDAVDQFDGGYFDWAYVDGNHAYEWALRDMRDYWPKIKVGGYLMGHDCLNLGECGVLDAVQQLCREHADTEFVWHGITREHPSKRLGFKGTPTFLVEKR